MITQAKSWRELQCLIAGDLYRYEGARGLRAGLRAYVREEGFRYTVLKRLAEYTRNQSWMRPAGWVIRWARRRAEIRLGISIPPETRIGTGLFIPHFGGIVVGGEVTIGRNCTLSHGVTIGQANRGERKGWPTLGDSVYIGPGAKIFGRIRIGSNVAIGANCVVTRDVEDNAVVAGIPGRVISNEGSEGYVTWKCSEDSFD